MTTQSTPTPVEKTHRTRNGLVAGAILILIGVFLLANNYLQGSDLGIYLLPALGALFLIWGLLVKNTGLLIPGGIMALIGGALLSGNTGIRALEIFGQVWPVGLILVGAYLLLRRNR